MNFNKYINLFCILFGALIAFYANAEKDQNVYLLILGISLLVIGLYRLSSTISSKRSDKDENDPML